MMYATSTTNGPLESTVQRSIAPTPSAQRSTVSAVPSQPSTTIRVSPTTYTSKNMPPVIPVLPSTSSHSSGGSRTLVPPTPVSKSSSVPSPLASQHSPLAVNDSDSGKPSDHTISRAKDRERRRSHKDGEKTRHKDRGHNTHTSGLRPGHRERTPSLPVNSSVHPELDPGFSKETVSLC